ncbi:MAG: DUF3592 domain-containing protein [Micrococcales bacterium]|nr:DUF3592 domain-containing protein [Micrococcales bacterium]
MSTVDPAVERARRQERRKGGIGSLLGLLVAAIGCLVCGYLFGRGIAGITGVFRWMASEGLNSTSSPAGPPYFWGVFVGSFAGFLMPVWYAVASRTFTGGSGLPVNGLTLMAAGATYGVWLQTARWEAPAEVGYGTMGTDLESWRKPWGTYAWIMYYADRWLPIIFAVVTVLILVAGIWFFARRNAKSTRAQNLLDAGRRASGVVTEATWTGVEINSRKLIRFTVRFTDHAGVQRWVTKRATFDPAGMPSAGMPATVFYDPARLDENKILVTLEPLEVVEQKLRDATGPSVPQWTSTAQNADPPPPWGSPSDGFYRGDTGHGYYRGDA